MSFSKRSDTAQFSESFLCLIGISRYYELDDNVYPVFLVDDDEEMDLFSFINHVDPTKVQIGEREVREGKVSLLDSTRGRVDPLAGVNEQGSQNDGVEDAGNINDDVQDARNNDEVSATVAKKPKGSKKKRKVAGWASGSSLPPKTLRADHGTFGASASTGGKSIAALQGLLERITLPVEVGVTAVATLSFITSSVSLTSEREGGGRTDSVTGPNLRTQHPSERFVVLSDSPCHSSSNIVDVEVSSVVRSLVSDPPIMTMTIATMVVANTSSVSVPRAGNEPVHHTLFADSASIGESNPDVAGPSHPAGTELSTDSFLCRKIWSRRPFIRHIVVDHLAPPVLFSQLHSMDYDQLLIEFNVRAARQTCLSSEVRLWLEHDLRDKKKLEGKCSRQTGLLKEKDTEIASLKAQLSLKEAKVAKAIRLHGQVATVEAAEVAQTNVLNGLKEQKSALEEEKSVFESKVVALESVNTTKVTELASLTAQTAKLTQDLSELGLSCDELSVKASSLEAERDRLVSQMSLLKGTCFELHDEVSGYRLFKEQIDVVQDEQVKVINDKVAGLDAELIGMALHLDEEFYPRAIGHAIDKGMQDGLAVGINHGKAGRGLVNVAAYVPFAEANYVSAVNALCVVDFPLLAQLIRGDVASQRLSIFDAMVPLIEPLFAENLVGEDCMSCGPVVVSATTALSTTFVEAISVPPILVSDYEVANTEAQA
ncbi:hypothetical protein Tco_0242643 [Tanacetum coccineum]